MVNPWQTLARSGAHWRVVTRSRLVAPLALAFGLTACGTPVLDVAPQPKPLVYVALGASDAVGIGAGNPERESWVAVLASEMPADTRLVNLGISGSLLRDALAQQLPVALDAAPDIVTVWLAVNDFNARVPLDEYSAQLDTLLDALTTRTTAHVLVANIPNLMAVPLYNQVPRDLLRAELARWNAVIADGAERHGATLIDLYGLGPELARRPDLVGADGFHPSTEGHRRLADVMWATIVANRLLP
ncbi:MAG TPA: SGNH/GDSL hydrolase family protein [Chloroflexota bacterium]|nr:SGNH/GDSL hydrolase family protein [Chloroflexota bacterium]